MGAHAAPKTPQTGVGTSRSHVFNLCWYHSLPCQVLIRDLWTALPVGTGYRAPSIVSVLPPVLPVAGGLISISGTDFGDGPCSNPTLPSTVALLLTPPTTSATATFNPGTRQWDASPPLALALANCTLQSWTSSLIRCTVPPGLDPNVTLVVTAGGQARTVLGQLHMEAPALLGVVPDGVVSTAGGSIVEVQGSGFPLPPWPVAVLVGDTICEVLAASRMASDSLRCRAPRGFGRAGVAVFSPLQESPSNASASVVYSPPVITDVVTPSRRPIEGGFPVVVTGQVRG
jgi:hypothetical protein